MILLLEIWWGTRRFRSGTIRRAVQPMAPAGLSAVLAAIVFLAPCTASAGYVIQARVRDSTAKQPREYQSTVVFDGSMLKLDSSQFTGRRTSVHYSSDEDIIREARHDSRDYVQMNVETLARIGDSIRNAVDSIRKAGGTGTGQANKDAFTVRQTKEVADVSGVRCRRFEIMRNNVKIQDAWVALWKDAGTDSTAFKVVRRFASCYERLTKSMGNAPMFAGIGRIPVSPLLQIDGYPMRLRHYENGKLAYEFSLGKPEKKAVDPASLRVPSNYRKALY